MTPRFSKPLRFHRLLGITLPILMVAPAALAQESVPEEEVIVEAVKKAEQGPLLPDVSGTRICAGKKATQTMLSKIPVVVNNNHRQAFSQLPGLLISEMNNHSIMNINYRGIGDPHESQDLLTLKDGIPIGVDRLGYSTTYYVPPFESVERVELIRGGGALLYGPQPGPVLNYVTYDTPTQEGWHGSTSHTAGSFGTYSAFNRGSMAQGPWGALAYQYHSHSNGPRANEGFDVSGGSAKMTRRHGAESKWTLNVDAHESEAREPGRLTLAQYQLNREQTPRPGDRLEISRYAASLKNETDVSANTKISWIFYGSYYDRWSLRRTSNTSTQNNLDRRETSAGGIESRVRHDYQAFGDTQTLTAGATFYTSSGPRTQDRSATGRYPTELGNPIFDFDYRTVYGALYGENRFLFGNLSIVPGFRLDLLNQRVKENFNTSKTSALHNIDEFTVVPLVGLGIQYDIPKNSQLYANISQGYKPAQFDDLAPTGNNTLPATSLDEGKTWTYELGARGNPLPWLQFDTSIFRTVYDNFFGTVTVGSNTQRQNVGKAIYQGADLAGEVNLTQLAIPSQSARFGTLNLYGNVSLLDAEFDEGPRSGLEPAFAPAYLAKAGLIYRWASSGPKVALLGTFVEDHFWVDDNAAGGTGLTAIPAYMVWDLTGEMALVKDTFKIFLGINNLLDEGYFSRVRSDGIEPATGRTYYAGAKLEF